MQNNVPLLVVGTIPDQCFSSPQEYALALSQVLRIPIDTISVIKGAKGDKGDKGAKGNQGDPGPPGSGIDGATAAGIAMITAADSNAQRALLSIGNVNNTSDANKPISTATQTALNNIILFIPQKTIYVGRYVSLNSNVITGGGTDVTVALNALFALYYTTPTLFIFEGCALISNTLIVGGDATLEFRGSNSGLYKANYSTGHILTNRLSGVTMVDDSIRIFGGTFNGNYPFNGAPGSSRYEDNGTGDVGAGQSAFWKVGFWFAGLRYLEMRNTTLRNATTFAVILGGVLKARLYDYRAYWTTVYPPNSGCNNDGLHWWGDNPDTEVHGFYSNGDDDCLAFNTDENWSIPDIRRTNTTTPGTTNSGNIGRVLVEDAVFDNASNGVRFISQGNPSGNSITEIILRRVKGIVNRSDMTYSGTNAVGGAVNFAKAPPIGRLEIVDWNVSQLGNIQAEKVGTAYIHNIDPQCTARVIASHYGGNYYDRPLIVSPNAGIRKASVIPYSIGDKVLDLLTGSSFSCVDRAGVAADSAWISEGAMAARAPTHLWDMKIVGGVIPDLIGSVNMVPSGGCTVQAGPFGNGIYIPNGQNVRAAIDIRTYTELTIAGWFEWGEVNTGTLQTFIEYSDSNTPRLVLYGEPIQKAQQLDLQPILAVLTENAQTKRAAYPSNLNGVQRHRRVFLAFKCKAGVATVFCDRDKYTGLGAASNWNGAVSGTLYLSLNNGPRNVVPGAGAWYALGLWDQALPDDVLLSMSKMTQPNS